MGTKYEFSDEYIKVTGLGDFSLATTLDCGQCFRWEADENGVFSGITGKNGCRIAQFGEEIRLYGVSRKEFDGIWREYFDFDRDYDELKKEFCEDKMLAKAVGFAPGIRILKQDRWEALCSFIISQNNNIKRIKGIIGRLCENFGDKTEFGMNSFPDAEKLAGLCEEELAPLRCGFRAGYVLDAARKVADGEIDLETIQKLPLEEARTELMKIRGVGPKVAECALLYGMGRLECFPVDVWIKRAMSSMFPEGLPKCAEKYACIAQQYIFHYVRTYGEK